ncbi:hypothetical protein CJF31_00006375 [Rutstroemia sp. NJR-2017a BVV2]|nr:hypothetical protein CJF31_00006375 [Rutstroemia sp. NJR-2017a BVV2]
MLAGRLYISRRRICTGVLLRQCSLQQRLCGSGWKYPLQYGSFGNWAGDMRGSESVRFVYI